MKRLIECVPNFSEGNNLSVIKEITDTIESVAGVKLLDVRNPGKATNRTVVTFAGRTPTRWWKRLSVLSKRLRRSSTWLSTRANTQGLVPPMSALLVPVSGISMEETAEYARRLAKRVGGELGIPVYCYENAAFAEERRSLPIVAPANTKG